MKKMFGLAILFCIIWACEAENLPLPTVDQRFTNSIPECTFGAAEMNCTQIIDFRANGVADFSLGGSDIIERGTYERNAETITLHTGIEFWGSMVFDIEDDVTLRLRSDDSIWTLDKN